MSNNIFDVFFIRTLPISYLLKTIESFFSTLPTSIQNLDFTVVGERSQREETLNYILSIRDKNKDVFIVADDIVFRPGWYESLEEYFDKGEILGFPMLFPGKTRVQDIGYDFIEVDGELTYRGLYKNAELENVQVPAYRYCDSICGCAMYIKKEVLDKVLSFSLDGNNRIGEMIFTHQASEFGFKTCVLNSFLYHGGISTKQNKNIKLASISWIYEKEKWKQNVKKYFKNVIPQESFTQVVSETLANELSSAKKVLIYGCGTVADFIIRQKLIRKFDICSGLPEEINRNFLDHTICDIGTIDKFSYDKILISAIGYEKEINEKYFFGFNTIKMKRLIMDNIIKYDIV